MLCGARPTSMVSSPLPTVRIPVFQNRTPEKITGGGSAPAKPGIKKKPNPPAPTVSMTENEKILNACLESHDTRSYNPEKSVVVVETTLKDLARKTGLSLMQVRYSLKGLVERLGVCSVSYDKQKKILSVSSLTQLNPSEQSTSREESMVIPQGVSEGAQPQAVASPPSGGTLHMNSKDKEIKAKNKKALSYKPSLSPSQNHPGIPEVVVEAVPPPADLQPPRVKHAPAKGFPIPGGGVTKNLVDQLFLLRDEVYPHDAHLKTNKSTRGLVSGICKNLQRGGVTPELVESTYRLYLSDKSPKLVRKRHPWEFFSTDFGRYVEAQIPASSDGQMLAEKLSTSLRKISPEMFSGDISKDVDMWARDFDVYLKGKNRPVSDIAGVIEWLPNDEFYSRIVRNALLLQKHYAAICLNRSRAMKGDKTPARKTTLNLKSGGPPKMDGMKFSDEDGD